ncbi:MAG: hypothetical protein HN909_04215, partial [Phycisphaerales bacterium]|nr:hypothetical protein [Phycisphaerales bacterium]
WAVKEDSPIAKSKLVVEKPSFIQEDAQEAWKKQGEEFYKNAIAKGALDASAPHSVVAEVDRANYVAPAGKALVEVTVNKLEERNTPDLGFLRFIVYIMVIAGFVQLVEMIIERFSPVLHINLGIYLPLITVNCAILGASMDMGSDLHGVASTTVLSSATYGLACGLGWMIVILLMAGIRSRLDSKSIPRPMRGLGVTLVVTGLMAMAFMGFKGVDKNLKDTQVSPDAEVAEAPKTPETEAPKAETPKAESKKGGQA